MPLPGSHSADDGPAGRFTKGAHDVHHDGNHDSTPGLSIGPAVGHGRISPLLTLLVPDVEASKNSKKRATSIAKRAQEHQEFCELGGGTATVSVRPGGTTVSCTGGAGDGNTCTFTSKKTRCSQTLTKPDEPAQPLQPDPLTADPGDVPTVPLEPDGGGVVLTSLYGTHERTKHHRRQHRRRHGKGRKG